MKKYAVNVKTIFSLPASFDCRAQGWVIPVGDQGSYGSGFEIWEVEARNAQEAKLKGMNLELIGMLIYYKDKPDLLQSDLEELQSDYLDD